MRIFLFLLILCLPLRAETMSSGVLMSGTRYQTPYYVKTGAQSGPTIVVVGGVHGDETASYLAARQLKNWKVEAGTLVLVPDAHREAIARNTRGYPRNMNALFPGKKDGDAMERLAFEIWTLIKDSKPDLLITLHESRGFYVENRSRYGQTFTYDFKELAPRFEKVRIRLNAGIPVSKHRFHHKVEAHPTCPTYCAWKYLRVPATSIETTRTLPIGTRVQYQLAACRAFFAEWRLKVAPPTTKFSGS